MNKAKHKLRAKQKAREHRIQRNANQRKRTLIVVGEGKDMPIGEEGGAKEMD